MKGKISFLFAAIIFFTVFNDSSQTLVDKIGFKKTDKFLIIINDDAGMCHHSID